MSNKALLERAERDQREIDEKKARRKAELKRLTEEHDARVKAEAAEQKRKDDAARAKREAAFEAELEADARNLFFNGNSGAPESLYQSVREEYRRLVLQRRAEATARDTSHSIYRWQ